VGEATPTSGDGFVAWFEGIPCAGKTTLSRAVADAYRAAGRRVEVLDGDEVRRMFSPELGFSRKDREFHARRVSYVARMLARNGVAVLVAMITPYETSRQAARATVGARFVEIWLRCPVEVARSRDARGVYRQTQGPGSRVTGLDDPFEEPLGPELTVDTSVEGPEASARRILDHLTAHGLFGPALPA
jgi:adenylylsulfate kinase